MHDMALVSFALFKNRDAATEFRNLVLKGTSWNSAINQQAQSIIMRVDSSYQTQATLMPAELWRVASKSTNHELSFPISTNNGLLYSCGVEIHQARADSRSTISRTRNTRTADGGTTAADV